ncbi:hypothetical protein [Corynebacterium accolens]|uniref:hypothetical protein n=1 Tax=Corynebacterium accolens TaxID=38284 RepID=UPI002551C1A9|nr:hypothetical protein [Corynebacterium accolens]MDK8593438.1 hypothetical protein [Corynebacterium accolens]
MTPMTPEEAQRWLEEELYEGRVPQVHVRRALQTIADMDTETITTQPGPRGSWNGDFKDPHHFDTPPGTLMRRYTTEWSKA